MSTVLEQRCPPVTWPRRWGPWLAVLAALALLYVPTYVSLAHGLWRDEEYAHGPLVLAIVVLVVWRDRTALVAGSPARAPLAGALLLVFGLVLYTAGRALGIALFEVGSQLPVMAGVLLVTRGWNGIRRFGFALVFLAFIVPVPGFVLAAASAPLKEFVSAAVAFLLAALGYPVVREGVALTVGSHEMLVADACAGMASLTSLAAIVLLYAHLTGGALSRSRPTCCACWRWRSLPTTTATTRRGARCTRLPGLRSSSRRSQWWWASIGSYTDGATSSSRSGPRAMRVTARASHRARRSLPGSPRSAWRAPRSPPPSSRRRS
jgi:exosortase